MPMVVEARETVGDGKLRQPGIGFGKLTRSLRNPRFQVPVHFQERLVLGVKIGDQPFVFLR